MQRSIARNSSVASERKKTRTVRSSIVTERVEMIFFTQSPKYFVPISWESGEVVSGSERSGEGGSEARTGFSALEGV